MRAPPIAYGQRFEDLHLLRAFGERNAGFYLDIGAGHPVVDNVSFAFYLRGWRGILVEPNPSLARLSEAVRPRDHVVQALAGAEPGQARYFLVDDFHGLSTTLEHHARNAAIYFGKTAQEFVLPVTTLTALCTAHAPPAIDFLKVDVEGAEADVLRGMDFRRFRPKVVLVEALAPYTLSPAWDAFEPLLTKHGYRYVLFDSLNRYYVAEEEAELGERLADAPGEVDATPLHAMGGALSDAAHPDHCLATLLARGAMVRLPLLENDAILQVLTAGLTEEQLDRPLTAHDLVGVHVRLCGNDPAPDWTLALGLDPDGTLRCAYARIAESDWFRSRIGRISGSYSW